MDINDLKDFKNDHCIPSITMITGKRFSGKTTLLKNIMQNSTIKCWTVFISNQFENEFEMPNCDTHPIEELKEHLTTLKAKQQKLVRYHSKIVNTPFPKDQIKGVVIDDVLSKKMLSDPVFEELVMNIRHYNIVLIMTSTSSNTFPPVVRGNTDFCFVLHNSKKSLRTLYDHMFCSTTNINFKTFLEFVKSTSLENALDQCRYDAVVYCLNSTKFYVFKNTKPNEILFEMKTFNSITTTNNNKKNITLYDIMSLGKDKLDILEKILFYHKQFNLLTPNC
jgi:predicted AAA+ superfamily ATPase